jgi:hypothetical protein
LDARRLLGRSSPNDNPFMDQPARANRYMLVPRVAERPASGPRVRRYSLARVGLTARSAAAEERLEKAARFKQA